MAVPNSKALNLKWNQDSSYWLCVIPHEAFPARLEQVLKDSGLQSGPWLSYGTWMKKAERQWSYAWQELYRLLQNCHLADKVEIAVVPGDEPPDATNVDVSRASIGRVDAIASSLWLGEALMAGNVLCYLQPVVSTRDKVFGYESFARVRQPDGKIIAGKAIVEASRALGIEHTIDRQLQVQAIQTFVTSQCEGALFINFFPGFIQRPDVYMEGLNDTVRAHGVIPRHIVLDVMQSDALRDLTQLKRVAEYCKSKGYAVALDDIESTQNIKSLLAEIKPDFVKLDMHLVHRVTEGAPGETARSIIESCHGSGALVIAEGVETEEMFSRLKELQVDLFQGYLFSPPVPAESIQRKGAAIA